MANYKRKTRDVWRPWSNYGYGWEVELEEDTYKEARQRLREYQENGGGVYKLQKGRERIEEA